MFQKISNEQELNVLLISNEEKSHYVLIKDFNRLMYSKTKHKDKKHFCMDVYRTLLLKNYWIIIEKDAYRIMILKQLYIKLEQLNLKALINKYLYHLTFMLI